VIFHTPTRRRGVNSRIDDPVGTGIALLVGTLAGIAASTPMLPRSVPLVDATVGPVGAALLAGRLAVVAVPVGVVALSLVSVQLDR
jgi:hypothetical protein